MLSLFPDRSILTFLNSSCHRRVLISVFQVSKHHQHQIPRLDILTNQELLPNIKFTHMYTHVHTHIMDTYTEQATLQNSVSASLIPALLCLTLQGASPSFHSQSHVQVSPCRSWTVYYLEHRDKAGILLRLGQLRR